MNRKTLSILSLALIGCGLMESYASAQTTSPKTTVQTTEDAIVDILAGSGAVKPQSGSVIIRDSNTGRARQLLVQDGQAVTSAPRVSLSTTVQMEKAAYLGIASTPLPSALREQLNLKKGAGILVERVEPDSPAQVAGIKQYDVIEKLDDQILINGQQLAILVRMRSADEEIKLSIIRQGQRQVVPLKLVEKELPVLGDANLWGLPGGGMSADEGNVTLFGSKVGAAATTIREIQKTQPKLMRINVVNEPYRLEYSEQDQQSHLKVVDNRSNQMIFDGPVDTEEQRSLLPDQVKRSIGQLKPLRSTTKPAAQPFIQPGR